MKILAFDTVAAAASVAVFLDGEKIFSLRENMDRGHSEALVPMIKKCGRCRKELVSSLNV